MLGSFEHENLSFSFKITHYPSPPPQMSILEEQQKCKYIEKYKLGIKPSPRWDLKPLPSLI